MDVCDAEKPGVICGPTWRRYLQNSYVIEGKLVAIKVRIFPNHSQLRITDLLFGGDLWEYVGSSIRVRLKQLIVKRNATQQCAHDALAWMNVGSAGGAQWQRSVDDNFFANHLRIHVLLAQTA